MLHFDIIYLREGIDPAEGNNSKEYMVCYYWFFNNGLRFQDSVCNGCHNLTLLCRNISDIAIIIFKGINYCYIIHHISKSDAIPLLQNYVLDTRSYIKKCISNKSILKTKSVTIILTIDWSKKIRNHKYFNQ